MKQKIASFTIRLLRFLRFKVPYSVFDITETQNYLKHIFIGMFEPGRQTYPISYCLQQASLKSVTGDSSAYMAWPE